MSQDVPFPISLNVISNCTLKFYNKSSNLMNHSAHEHDQWHAYNKTMVMTDKSVFSTVMNNSKIDLFQHIDD